MDWPNTGSGSTEPETSDKLPEPMHTLNYIWKLVSYLTENSLHYKHQLEPAVYRNNCWFFCESQEAHRYTILAKSTGLNVTRNGTYSLPLSFKELTHVAQYQLILSTVAVYTAEVSRVMNNFKHSSVWVVMGLHPLYLRGRSNMQASFIKPHHIFTLAYLVRYSDPCVNWLLFHTLGVICEVKKKRLMWKSLLPAWDLALRD
jgi:hypothetical protein